MMKKFLSIFVLGLFLFAISCGTTDPNGDTPNVSNEDLWKASVAGKKFTVSGWGMVEFDSSGNGFSDSDGYTYNFITATSSTKAIYNYSYISYYLTLSGSSLSIE